MQRNAVLGAAAGVAGGLLGSWMMVRFNHLVGGLEHENGNAPRPEYRSNAAPNDTDGTISDEPASIRAASEIGESLTDRPLTHGEKRLGGSLLHYAFGAVAGGLYGAAAERTPAVRQAFGLPFGATVWLAADEIGLPLAGLSAHPAHYPVSRHAAALGTHLVFGATVEAVRRLLRGR
jgi:putative membrane protein